MVCDGSCGDTEQIYPQWRELKQADSLACKLDEQLLLEQLGEFDRQIEEIRNAPAVHPLKNLAINGRDLLQLGFEEGRRIGDVLRALHEQVLDDPNKNERDYLIREAKKLLETKA